MVTKKIINLDYAAGKPVDSRVLDSMLPYMNRLYGNPSSLHSMGQEAKKALYKARKQVSELINAERPENIIFTSSATESNNLAIKGVANRNKEQGTKIIASNVEHISVINPIKYLTTKGFESIYLPVNNYGEIDLTVLEKELDDKTILVTTTYANGEIGTIEPIKEISKLIHAKKAVLHVDATAAAGQVPIDVQDLGVDLMTISSNDMYGPKGVGALYVKDGVRIEPLIHGGGQEKGIRSGTENMPGIIGFGIAAEIAKQEMQTNLQKLTKLRDRFIEGLLGQLPYTFLNGHPTKRLPDNVSVRYSFIEGESMLLSLEMNGILVSSGSACASKTLEPSRTLLATGLKHEEAHGSIMFTLGRESKMEDIEYVIGVMPSIINRLRDMSPLTPKELKNVLR
jgi:cysteine desulfurase